MRIRIKSFLLGCGAAVICCAFRTPLALAKKGNEPVYEDPYDLAAGGASLTRATKAGVFFANPALLPYGTGFHRWAGLDLGPIVNKESIDATQSMSAGTSGDTSEYIDKIFSTPIHAGLRTALSYLNRGGGLGVFARAETDVEARQFGSTGLPELRFGLDSYNGAVGSLAMRLPVRAISLGVTAKYLYVTEQEIVASVADTALIESFQNGDAASKLAKYNTGIGYDVGSLIFLQGHHLDLRIAGKVDDVGDTKLSGEAHPDSLKQVVSGGVGLTLHNEVDAIHLSADYRDILGAYEEEMFKKVRAGAKIMLRSHLGVAAGIHHGYSTYGAEIDAVLLRISATYYTREMGDHPNVNPRRIYLVSISLGY